MFHQSIVVHRYFFALRPPPLLARRIAAAAHWFEAGGAVTADRLHMTIFILDDLSRPMPALEKVLCGIGERLAAAPVPVRLDRAIGSERSIALRPAHAIPELRSLHRDLTAAARAAGVAERADHAFSPHLTLGYRDGTPFNAPIAPVAWQANELVLIHSRVGQTRHDVLGRWPLTGGGQLALF